MRSTRVFVLVTRGTRPYLLIKNQEEMELGNRLKKGQLVE